MILSITMKQTSVQILKNRNFSQSRILNKITIISRCLLSFPFHIDSSVRISKWQLSLSIVLMTSSMVFTLYNTFFTSRGGYGWSPMSTTMSRSGDVLQNIYNLASVLFFASRVGSMNEYLEKVTQARSMLRKVGLFQKINVSFIVLWIEFFIIFLTFALLRLNTSIYSLVYFTVYRFDLLVGTSLVFVYCSLLKIVGDQMSFINSKTEKLLGERGRSKAAMLILFSDVHQLMCSALEELEATHNYPLVALFLGCFIKILVMTKSLISNLAIQPPSIILVLCALLTYHVTKLCYVVFSSSYTSRQTKKFNSLLLENIIKDVNQEWNVKLDLHLAMNREVEFTAAGFFVIDHPILHSMLAMMTSFLVVLIQTEKPPPAE